MAVALAVSGGDPIKPFELRGNSFTLITLRLLDPSDDTFFMRLNEAVQQAPGFYRNAPVVLDLGAVAKRAPINIAEFCRRLRQQGLIPIGAQNGNQAWDQVAVNAGLSIFPAGRTAPLRHQTPRSAIAEAEEPEAPRSSTRVITEPVRSGQQVYNPHGDLVVLAPVSHGAELLADGHIHVYGPLRGRVLAGLSGDKSARIYCKALDAELVSIAGIYALNDPDTGEFKGRNVQVRLDGERLVIEALP